MVFPLGGPEPRHPSQLYEAFFEGAMLFALLYVISRSDKVRARPGLLTGIFMLGYAAARAAWWNLSASRTNIWASWRLV